MDTRGPDWWDVPLTHPETADDQRRFLNRPSRPTPGRARARQRLLPWLLFGAVFVGLPALAIWSGPPEPRLKTRPPAPAAAEASPAPSPQPAYYCEPDNGAAALARCQRGDWLYAEPPEDVLRYCQMPSGIAGLSPAFVQTPRGVYCLYRGEARQARTP